MFIENNKDKSDWKSILFAAFFALNIVFMVLISIFLVLFSGYSFNSPDNSSSLVFLFLAGGIFLLGLLFIPGMLLNFGNVVNHPFNFSLYHINNKILLPAIMVIWLCLISLGIFIDTNFPSYSEFIPILNIFTISLPILAILTICYNNLFLPGQRKMWTLFGLGLLFPPVIALTMEFIVIVILILLYMLYASFSPGLLQVLNSAVETIQSGILSSDERTTTIAKLFFAPGIPVLAFIAFSILIPMIEETSKVLLIVPLLKKIQKPVEGFVIGSFLGAAFALVENIGFTGTSSADWGLNSIVRASAALPHIFNSGLLGYSLVDSYQKKSIRTLLNAFISVIVIHGAWNAISLGLALTDLTSYLADVPFILRDSYPWIAGWMLLASGVFIGIIKNNQKMLKMQNLEE